jgi:hypothetical protein
MEDSGMKISAQSFIDLSILAYQTHALTYIRLQFRSKSTDASYSLYCAYDTFCPGKPAWVFTDCFFGFVTVLISPEAVFG